MSVYQVNNLRLTNALINNIDTTKRVIIDTSSISTGTTRTLTVPNANTTIVGTDASQTLTNKNITGNTNTVEARQLTTTSAPVIVGTSGPPSIDQILTATSSTSAAWLNNIILYRAPTSGAAAIKEKPSQIAIWIGKATTTAGVATFTVTQNGTAGGTAIFTDLSSAYITLTCRFNGTTSLEVPFAAIRTIVGNVVTVSVARGNSGSILVGGTYSGTQFAENGTEVIAHIIGLV